MRRATAFALAWLLAAPLVLARDAEQAGILILAHGGSNEWDNAVRRVVRQTKLAPIQVAFGMGMHAHEAHAVQDAVKRLRRKGIARLVVIPLLVSSHSEVYRQYQYLFGSLHEPVWPEAGAPLSLGVPTVVGHGLDDHPLLGQILLDRARELSRVPEQETVILVSHGPNDDEENQRWLVNMKGFETFLQQEGKFRAVVSRTIRDDAPKAVKEQAIKELREAVRGAGEEGRALVVPVLLASGGIERKLPKMLGGLSYAWNGRTILPDARISEWLIQQAGELAHPPEPPAELPPEPPAEPVAGADQEGVLE